MVRSTASQIAQKAENLVNECEAAQSPEQRSVVLKELIAALGELSVFKAAATKKILANISLSCLKVATAALHQSSGTHPEEAVTVAIQALDCLYNVRCVYFCSGLP